MRTNDPSRRVIVLDDLGQELARGHADKCVDFQTGAIVRLSDCPRGETGEGRPALRRGKRFIRIPNLDEAYDEAAVGPDDPRMEQMLEDWSKDARLRQIEERQKLETQDPGSKRTAALNRQLDDLLDRLAPGWEKDAARRQLCVQDLARRWIASLRPPFRVAVRLLFGNAGGKECYDPLTGWAVNR